LRFSLHLRGRRFREHTPFGIIRNALQACLGSDEQCTAILGPHFFSKLGPGSGRSIVPSVFIPASGLPSDLNLLPLNTPPRIRGLTKLLGVLLHGPVERRALNTDLIDHFLKIPFDTPDLVQYNAARKEENKAALTLLRQCVLRTPTSAVTAAPLNPGGSVSSGARALSRAGEGRGPTALMGERGRRGEGGNNKVSSTGSSGSTTMGSIRTTRSKSMR